MTEEKVQQANPPDPSVNVRSIVYEATQRFDDLQKAEVKRIDAQLNNLEKTSGIISIRDYFNLKIDLKDDKVQSQFTSAKEAVGIASTAQEKAMAAALEGTKDALNKADVNNDKRFGSISEKIDGIADTMSKNTGASGLYVTHSDLATVVDKIQTGFKTSMESFEISLKPIFAFMNSQTGQQKGISGSWGVALGIFGLVSTILGIFAIISRFLP